MLARVLLLCAAAPALGGFLTPLWRKHYDAHLARLHSHTTGLGAPLPMYFNQTMDHFDVTGMEPEWLQRFWVNASLWKRGGPVFLYIEGEGSGSAFNVVEGEHVELAAAYGALLVSLEHRYYGASVPTESLSTPNMRFLSSHQALADIARFYALHLVPTYNLTRENKVVTFGGSYPGALSAWARLRLPHIVHGSISTSSPVQASFDDVSYNNVVSSSLSYPLVGGSAACLSATKKAFQAIDAAFGGSADERHAMATKLNSCTGLDGANDTMWAASNLGGFVQGMVQYNLETSYSIADYCAEMVKPGVAPIDAFAAVIKATQGSTCMDNSYADYLLQLQNTTADRGAHGLGLRQWTWQCCTQFSYWQDCDADSECPLSKAFMTLDSNTQQCQDAFGPQISRYLNFQRTLFSNAYTGGASIQSSNIIFVNGNVDPWHALSVYNSTAGENGPRVSSVFSDGTAHCRNMCVSLRGGDKLPALPVQTTLRPPNPTPSPHPPPPPPPLL
jgi:serine protease 16